MANYLATIFGVLGSLMAVLVFLAPLPTFIKIYKKKSSMGFQTIPYLAALFSSTMWIYYASLKHNVLVICINTSGCVLEILYISIHLLYGSREAKTHTMRLLGLINIGLFTMIVALTSFIFEGVERLLYVGWISIFFSVCVFIAPLSNMLEVVRTRSVEFMPFWLSFFLTLNAMTWFLYGLFKKDLLISLPNILGFLFSVAQMVLYAIFRNKTPRNQDGEI